MKEVPCGIPAVYPLEIACYDTNRHEHETPTRETVTFDITNITCSEVLTRVWVGSIHAAFNCEAIQARGITHILNVSGLPATFPRHFTYLTIDIRDKKHSNLLGCIPASNIFIEAGVEHGGVLIHCAGGRSRSPALVIAFMMSSIGLTYEEGLAKVKAVRPVVSLNRGFEIQLRCYEKAGHDVFSAHQVMLRNRMTNLLTSRSEGTFHRVNHAPENPLMTPALPARLRLTRPGSPSVQVIPPLRAMGTQYCCRFCNQELFAASNIVRHDENTECNKEEDLSVFEIEETSGIFSNDARLSQTHVDTQQDDSGEFNEITVPSVPQSSRAKRRANTSIYSFQTYISKETENVEKIKNLPMDRSSEEQQLNEPLPQSSNKGNRQLILSQIVSEENSPICRFGRNLAKAHYDNPCPSPIHSFISAEKRRWLAKMTVLEKSGGSNSSSQIEATATADEEHLRTLPCTYCFIEPLLWMGDITDRQGDLKCPNESCNVVVGSWNWDGAKCECGGEVSPSFRIDTRVIVILERTISRDDTLRES